MNLIGTPKLKQNIYLEIKNLTQIDETKTSL